ncbi:MAG: sulfite exporter TauE/SafE family protein [Gammaproteobacteria bacterium]|nr:sulfite exporter TauE/SafE family protein [Gammaproteobacteria bacterium]
MPHELTFVSAFLVGLVGSVHCIGMCGGIVSALTLSAIHQGATSKNTWLYIVLYNLGRISSYVAGGIAGGFLGQQILDVIFLRHAQLAASLLASGFMIALGLYVAGWWPGLMKVEQLGQILWRYMEPLGRRFIPVASAYQALLLGLIWGWLPCGMVYTALVWSLSAGAPLDGGLLMLGFGLGTLPVLLMIGGFAGVARAFLQKPATRQLAGAVIIVLACLSLLWQLTQSTVTESGPAHSQHRH